VLLGSAACLCGATPALGAECGGTGIPTFCLEQEGKLVEFTGTETYTGKLVAGTQATLLTLTTVPTSVACAKDASAGNIVQPEPLVKAVPQCTSER
jgi:hypothetical protein